MIKAFTLYILLAGCCQMPVNAIHKTQRMASYNPSVNDMDTSDTSYWYIGSNRWSATHKYNGKEELLLYIQFNLTGIF